VSGSPPILPDAPNTPPPPPPAQPPRFDLGVRTIARVVVVVLVVVGVLYLLWLLRKPISWLLIATFIAVALSGPVNLMSRKLPRGIAILLAYLGLVLIPIGVAAIVVPPLVREGTNLANDVPGYVQDLQGGSTTTSG
jgi:predicted PurR-regulated permease PerM